MHSLYFGHGCEFFSGLWEYEGEHDIPLKPSESYCAHPERLVSGRDTCCKELCPIEMEKEQK